MAASAAVAFTAGSAFVAPVVGAAPGPLGSLGTGSLGSVGGHCGEQVVTSVNAEGDAWATPGDETAAAIGAAPEGAPAPVGKSALKFSDENKKNDESEVTGGSSLYKTVDMPLADLLDDEGKGVKLSFDYFASGQAPALQIRLLGANVKDSEDKSNDGFATIVWSPAASDGTWKIADANAADKFWVTRTLVGEDGEPTLARGAETTLAKIVELNPEAKVTAYGVQRTQENKSTNVAIDNFQFGCEVTNFEAPAEAGPLGSLSGIFGSLTGSL
ncbi:hypothetical protein ACWIE7_17550 [Dietzia sp. NPDC055343]